MTITDITTTLAIMGYKKVLDYSDKQEQPLADYGYGTLGSGRDTQIQVNHDTGFAYLVDLETGETTHRARF